MSDQVDDDAVERHEVSRVIPADPAAIFAVVSSPEGHVAINASGMLQDSTGVAVKAKGDEFVIHMDRESLGDLPMGKYDVTVTITGYEQALLAGGSAIGTESDARHPRTHRPSTDDDLLKSSATSA